MQIYAPIAFDASLNDYFDSKAIYCLFPLSNFTNNKDASRSANSPELKFLLSNARNESVTLPLHIQNVINESQ